MKILFKLSFVALAITVLTGFSMRSGTAKVKGNCEMCEERIEEAALRAGASTASWNQQNKILSFQFDPAKTNKANILKKIADSGHDNELFRAKDSVYENLPPCCHYERSKPERKAVTKKRSKRTYGH